MSCYISTMATILNRSKPMEVDSLKSSSLSHVNLSSQQPSHSTSDSSLELVIGIYPGERNAKEVLKSLERLQREQALVLVSTAVLLKNSKGRLLTRQIVDWNITEGGLIDGLAASLVSLLSPIGSLGTVAFEAGGLSVEVLVENLAELGLCYNDLLTIAKSAKPGSSILICLVKRPWLQRLSQGINRKGARILHKTMVPAMRSRLGDHFIDLAQAVILEHSRQGSY